jgi:exodeoxyribonuclease VII large subunit
LPILVGIGHQRDSSIVDMVAHRSLKTPTAVAEFLIEKMQNTENELFNLIENISNLISNKTSAQSQTLEQIKWRISHRLKNLVDTKQFGLKHLNMSIKNHSYNIVQFHRNKISLVENKINSLSPLNLLKRGYSITVIDSKRVTSVKEVQKGNKVTTILTDGSFTSEIV